MTLHLTSLIILELDLMPTTGTNRDKVGEGWCSPERFTTAIKSQVNYIYIAQNYKLKCLRGIYNLYSVTTSVLRQRDV